MQTASSRHSRNILLATVVILASVAWLAFTGVRDNKSYYVTISELQGMGNKAYTRHLRVAGNVAPGSIHARRHQRQLHPARTGQDPPRQLPGHRAATRHLQGRRPGPRRRHLRQRRRLPRHPAPGQVRLQIRRRPQNHHRLRPAPHRPHHPLTLSGKSQHAVGSRPRSGLIVAQVILEIEWSKEKRHHPAQWNPDRRGFKLAPELEDRDQPENGIRQPDQDCHDAHRG